MSDRYPGTLIHSSLLFIFSKEKEISPSPYCLLMLHTHATRPNHFVKPTIMHHTSRIELIPLDRLEFLVQVSDCIDNEWKTQSHRVGLDTHAYRRSRERRIGHEEIAAAMDCPVGTVRSRIFRAREAIDNRLREVFDGGLGRGEVVG